jgi:hypothetical protein
MSDSRENKVKDGQGVSGKKDPQGQIEKEKAERAENPRKWHRCSYFQREHLGALVYTIGECHPRTGALLYTVGECHPFHKLKKKAKTHKKSVNDFMISLMRKR